ncbi:unnamed protein product, partial [Brenthis ino]
MSLTAESGLFSAVCESTRGSERPSAILFFRAALAWCRRLIAYVLAGRSYPSYYSIERLSPAPTRPILVYPKLPSSDIALDRK